jgi:hypothetical protein
VTKRRDGRTQTTTKSMTRRKITIVVMITIMKNTEDMENTKKWDTMMHPVK